MIKPTTSVCGHKTSAKPFNQADIQLEFTQMMLSLKLLRLTRIPRVSLFKLLPKSHNTKLGTNPRLGHYLILEM